MTHLSQKQLQSWRRLKFAFIQVTSFNVQAATHPLFQNDLFGVCSILCVLFGMRKRLCWSCSSWYPYPDRNQKPSMTGT